MQSSIPNDLSRQLHRALEPGERLAWTGHPQKDRAGKAALDLSRVFGICAAICGGIALITFGSTMMLHAIGAMLACLVIATAYSAKKQSPRRIYGVTNRRVVILQAGKQNSIESIFPEELHELATVERREGAGDLHLGRPRVIIDNWFFQLVRPRTVLTEIPAVAQVEQLISQTLSPRKYTPEVTFSHGQQAYEHGQQAYEFEDTEDKLQTHARW
jgi:hypothetical protein